MISTYKCHNFFYYSSEFLLNAFAIHIRESICESSMLSLSHPKPFVLAFPNRYHMPETWSHPC